MFLFAFFSYKPIISKNLHEIAVVDKAVAMAVMLTTREVADYLRIKERKVYELVRNGGIPCTRVTGKWLFPRDLIDLWLLRGTDGPVPAPNPPPPIVAGSQDPLLDWALQESGSDLAMLAGGSVAGLERLAEGGAVAAGLHLLDEDGTGYNVDAVRRALGGRDIVVLEWAWRRQGLVLAPGNPLGIEGLADLRRKTARIVSRQDGAGSALLLRHLLDGAELSLGDLAVTGEIAGNEIELGFAVLEGRADAGLAIEAVARRMRLEFLPLARERFDLAIGRREYFQPALQRLFAFARTAAFRRRAEELGGYDIGGTGAVIFNGP